MEALGLVAIVLRQLSGRSVSDPDIGEFNMAGARARRTGGSSSGGGGLDLDRARKRPVRSSRCCTPLNVDIDTVEGRENVTPFDRAELDDSLRVIA